MPPSRGGSRPRRGPLPAAQRWCPMPWTQCRGQPPELRGMFLDEGEVALEIHRVLACRACLKERRCLPQARHCERSILRTDSPVDIPDCCAAVKEKVKGVCRERAGQKSAVDSRSSSPLALLGRHSRRCSQRGFTSSACRQTLCECAAPPSPKKRHSREAPAGQTYSSPPWPVPSPLLRPLAARLPS